MDITSTRTRAIYSGLPLTIRGLKRQKLTEPPDPKFMTICIGCICQLNNPGRGIAIAIADKMLSTQETSFEPRGSVYSNAKIIPLTFSISTMFAGDPKLHAQIIHSIVLEIDKHYPDEESKKRISVKDTVLLYLKFYNEERSRRINTELLAQFGLSQDIFLARQKQLSEGFIERITTAIASFQMPGLDVIFLGVDQTGPHLWVVQGDTMKCCNFEGFVAIGAGASRAESAFMERGYHTDFFKHQALYLSYVAKKRAESTPGVGPMTDLLYIGPELWKTRVIPFQIMHILEKFYAEQKLAEDGFWTNTEQELHQFLIDFNAGERAENVRRATEPQPPSSQSPASGPSTTPPPEPGHPSDPLAARAQPPPGSSEGKA